VAVCIRMKKMGRTHRAFFRICATDKRAPRDGRVLEELGTYDPSVPETDARALFNKERVDYWLSVGALPSEKVGVLIKKYGTNGTHVEQQQAALDRLAAPKAVPEAGPAVPSKRKLAEEAAEKAAAEKEAADKAAAEKEAADKAAAEEAEKAAAKQAEAAGEAAAAPEAPASETAPPAEGAEA
jgi:small subunit ribosomal protein S16